MLYVFLKLQRPWHCDGSFLEGEDIALGLLYGAVAPAFAAYGDVALVAPYLHLLPFGYDVAVGVDAGVDNGLVAARAGPYLPGGCYFV